MGTRELPCAQEPITGFTVIEAESRDEAESIAQRSLYIGSIRVYEVRGA